MHSSMMRTARHSSRPGGSPPVPPTPRSRPPLGADPPPEQTPPEQTPPEQTPPEQAPPWEQAPSLWTEFLTQASENITFPQTSST